MSRQTNRLDQNGSSKKLIRKAGMLVVIFTLLSAYLLFSTKYPARGATAQQAATDTLTLSPTASQAATNGTPGTGTVTATIDLTTTATPSPTLTSVTASPTLTSTPTLGVVYTLTPTHTSIVLLTPSATELLPTATATATLLPLPRVTMIYPKVTATSYLMMAHRSSQAVQKHRLPWLISIMVRFWSLGLMLLVWGILAFWFIIIQHKLG